MLDPGSSYASNISYDSQGRTIQWLWAKTDTNPARGWNSCMTLPRILSIGEDGYLRQNPPPEFAQLRGEMMTVPAGMVETKPIRLGERLAGDCLEIEADFTPKRASQFGLRVRCGVPGKGTAISYSTGNATLKAGNASTNLGVEKQIRLRIFLDKRALEVYANDGAVAIFTTVNAGAGDLGIELFAEGGAAQLDGLRVWPMKPARFSLDKFRLADA